MGLFDNLPKLDDVRAAAEDAVSNAADAADKAARAAGDAASKVAEAAAPVAEKTAEIASFTAAKTSEAATNVADAVADVVKNAANFVDKLKAGDETGFPMPSGYQRLRRPHGDPEGMSSYVTQTSQALALVNVWPIEEGGWVMPFDDPQSVIDDIHGNLGDMQGLIEVETGTASSGGRCIYSIVKTLLQPAGSGVQYCLTMHVETEGGLVCVQGFFEEQGMTGMRESMVMAITRQDCDGDPFEGWMCDPYDPDRTSGVLMNRAEGRQYDADWPEHPLTLCRAMAEHVKAVC